MGHDHQQLSTAEFDIADLLIEHVADAAGSAQRQGLIVEGVFETRQGQSLDHCRQGYEGNQIAFGAEKTGLVALQHEQFLIAVQDSGHYMPELR